MRPRVLVVTTVHHPDDTRIREKTIRSLSGTFRVAYAARNPGPGDTADLEWVPLPGGRLRRNLAAWRIVLRSRAELVSLHDPELLPLGLTVRVLRRIPVVFDMHEDVPAQILTKAWMPALLRRPVAHLVGLMLRMAERSLTITLAEDSYAHNFAGSHPVIANYPEVDVLPRVGGDRSGAVYVGDVTRARGLTDAVAACSLAGTPLLVVGPVGDELAADLRSTATGMGCALTLTGRLPHAEAMAMVSGSEVAVSPLRDLPNYRFSIPTKVLEYLAIGVPVVASDLPATRRVVEGLDAVFLHPPGDVEAMAAALIAATTAEASAAAAAQVDRVRARFRWAADELVEVYSALLR